MGLFQILHISDLHIKCDEKFDRSVVLDSLIKRVIADKKAGVTPEIVVVTGDVAHGGLETEYEEAGIFFDILLSDLDLPPENLFLVPGNHDVNRKRYRKSDRPAYENMRELNEELENEEFRADLLKGMDAYFSFVESRKGHPQPLHKRLIPFVHVHETGEERKKIALVGLNSAWMCRASPDREKIAIGEFQINKAEEVLKKLGPVDLTLHLFHHPFQWLWTLDRKILRPRLNDSIILCGHLHDTEGGFTNDLAGEYFQFQAGGAYLGSESKWSNRFHYLTVDLDKEMILLDSRRFEEEYRQWIGDSAGGKNGKKNFHLFPNKETEEKTKSQSDPTDRNPKGSLELKPFEAYLASALKEHGHITYHGFETTLRVSLDLEKIYVNLRAHIHAHDFENTMEGRERWEKKNLEEKLSSIDIKGAFRAARKRGIRDMVVLGDPGSGKTTLLKYLLVTLVENKGEERLGLAGPRLPFFAPLRELKDPEHEDLPAFLIRVCSLDQYRIDRDILEQALGAEGTILLLDGLDETAHTRDRERVCRWIDQVRFRYPKASFMVTSRFAGYMGENRLRGNHLELAVLKFTPGEARQFLIRWYEEVETALHAEDERETFWRKKGRERAEALVERIEKSEDISRLAVNPLMLQIIALVHRDRGTLPQRRVELYEECVNVLLEKWDIAKGLKTSITASEARGLLQPLALWLHGEEGRRSATMEEIEKVVSGPLEEMGRGEGVPGELLLNIRDRSGIFMGHSAREWGFTHLTFQEYLAAEEIRNRGRLDTLVENYGERWWREVSLLALALDNPSILESFLEKIIPTKAFQKEMGLVLPALEDSIKKPRAFLAGRLTDKTLPLKSRANVIRLASALGGERIIAALREVVEEAEPGLSQAAWETLEGLNASKGGRRPGLVAAKGEMLIDSKDGAEMVLIHGGTFLYGSREDDPDAGSNEKPQRTLELPAFYMDKYPVTNERYCRFLNERKPGEKELERWMNIKGSYEKERCRIRKQRDGYEVEKGWENHSVIYVSWHGAKAFAKWANKRIPTEQEWEKAARGTEGRVYPWGDEFDPEKCNSNERAGGTTEVGKYPVGVSPYGCFDMAGNVWEWTDSWYDKDEDTKVVRGGSWINVGIHGRCALRLSNHPGSTSLNAGFRCART